MMAEPWRARPEYAVPLDEALSRLDVTPDYDPGGAEGPGPCVHTFRAAAVAIIGAHRRLSEVRELIERYGVEEAGPQATAMGHGLTLTDETGPLFLATKPEA